MHVWLCVCKLSHVLRWSSLSWPSSKNAHHNHRVHPGKSIEFWNRNSMGIISCPKLWLKTCSCVTFKLDWSSYSSSSFVIPSMLPHTHTSGSITSNRHAPHRLPVHLQPVTGGRPLLHRHQLCGHTWGGMSLTVNAPLSQQLSLLLGLKIVKSAADVEPNALPSSQNITVVLF